MVRPAALPFPSPLHSINQNLASAHVCAANQDLLRGFTLFGHYLEAFPERATYMRCAVKCAGHRNKVIWLINLLDNTHILNISTEKPMPELPGRPSVKTLLSFRAPIFVGPPVCWLVHDLTCTRTMERQTGHTRFRCTYDICTMCTYTAVPSHATYVCAQVFGQKYFCLYIHMCIFLHVRIFCLLL